MNLVFVYGTLKEGYHNHFLMHIDHERPPKLVTKEDVINSMTLYGRHEGIPFAVETDDPEDHITGEVWEVSGLTLIQLDGLEGHPYAYRRKLVDTTQGHKVWVYTWPKQLMGKVHLGPTWGIPHEQED